MSLVHVEITVIWASYREGGGFDCMSQTYLQVPKGTLIADARLMIAKELKQEHNQDFIVRDQKVTAIVAKGPYRFTTRLDWDAMDFFTEINGNRRVVAMPHARGG